MKLTILVDNYVPNQNDLLGEPSFSCHIEDASLKILFDAGLSGTPLRNAKRLKIDLSAVDYIVLSHGHLDHTWGLERYARAFAGRGRKKLLCHPDALKPKKYGRANIGIKGTERDLERRFEVIRTSHCTNLLSKLEIAKVARVGEAGSGTRIEF